MILGTVVFFTAGKLNNAVDHRCFSQDSRKNPSAPADQEAANGVKSVCGNPTDLLE
jgi:hypothetical protein